MLQAKEVLIEGQSEFHSSHLGVLKAALVFTYDSLGGGAWREQLPGWSLLDRKLPVARWYGVSIENNLLMGLKLVNNNLSGDINCILDKIGTLESLGNICALQELNLASSCLSGALEAGVVSKFKSLVICCLPFNAISGSIPPTFSECKGLAVLSLQSNKLGGVIPRSLGQCTNLRVLHLYANGLSGPLPDELKHLTLLDELRLWGNRLTGVLPESYCALSRLRVLHLANNKFSSQVGRCPLFALKLPPFAQ